MHLQSVTTLPTIQTVYVHIMLLSLISHLIPLSLSFSRSHGLPQQLQLALGRATRLRLSDLAAQANQDGQQRAGAEADGR